MVSFAGGMEQVGVRAVVEGAAAYGRDAQSVNRATRGMADEADRAAKRSAVTAGSLSQLGGRMQEVGRNAVVLGGALTIPGIAAGKLAIDFETAFAGVRKTVNATEPELARLRQGILDLSERVPASAAAIAQVAEAAGQLGIKTPNILEFTETMIQLGESTNLSATEAATALARLANIIELPQDRFDELGSAIVALGNNLATTESEIVTFALRIAGAGKQVGLSEDQILGFAGALSSVGLAADAGGTAISRTFVTISNAVQSGGDDLEAFAEVAGVSAQEYKAAFERDAAGATVAFITGLRRISDEGGNVFAVLDDLELGEVRVRDALLRAAGAGDLFTEALGLSKQAINENTALQDEFNRRLETTGAQLAILRNQIVAVLIDAGDDALPVLRGIITVLGVLVAGFKALPGPVRTGAIAAIFLTGAVIALSGAASILIGSLLRLAPAAAVASGGLTSLGVSAGVAQLAIAGGFIGALITAAAVLGIFASRTQDATEEQEKFLELSQRFQRELTTEQIEQQIAAAEDFIATKKEQVKALEEERLALIKSGGIYSSNREEVNKLTEEIDGLNNQIDHETERWNGLTIAQQQQREAAQQVAAIQDEVESQIEATTGAIDDQASALANLSSSALAAVLAGQLLNATAAGLPIEEYGKQFELAVDQLRGIVSEENALKQLTDSLLLSAGARTERTSAGGGGGVSAGRSGTTTALGQIVQRQQEEVLRAYIEGGVLQARATREGQAYLATKFAEFQAEAARVLGIEVPDEYRSTWEQLLETQREAGQQLIEQEREIAEERRKAAEQLRQAQTAARNQSLAGNITAAQASPDLKFGFSASTVGFGLGGAFASLESAQELLARRALTLGLSPEQITELNGQLVAQAQQQIAAEAKKTAQAEKASEVAKLSAAEVLAQAGIYHSGGRVPGSVGQRQVGILQAGEVVLTRATAESVLAAQAGMMAVGQTAVSSAPSYSEVRFERGAFAGMFEGATLTGSEADNERIIKRAVRDVLTESVGRDAFLGGGG